MNNRFFILLGCLLLTSLAVIASMRLHETDMPKEIHPPLGLRPVPWPEDNPYSKDKAELGRLLYFDKRLSSDQTVSCASCHNRACGYGDCRALPEGIEERLGARHSPTIINAAYSTHLFWDGRASSLEEQCLGPLGNSNEMTSATTPHEAHRQCTERVKEIPGYLPLFKKAFSQEEITIQEIAQAIATFERTLLSGNSPYDRYRKGNHEAMTPEQIRGMALFKGKAQCSRCHADFSFASDLFQNIGIGMDAPQPDLGRYHITKNERDWGTFKTPILRDCEHFAPYMHDGSLPTLEAVIDYYNKGGIKNKNLHWLMRSLNLTDEEKRALVSFLKALSGEGWQHYQEPTQFPN